ncbi:hypothetical protein L211DRAFT_325171 [Terfezia boudieri ATCC MYA-4762]|uniref:Uncharacterized protein n=1 Tax=Terfezia boudieri ATCC MYA-4762 TaxID=1051890 RepID=A0A3N4LHW2_9PEZI|nr:hypothetical protein L211DRAFT_325171 [Terfezia boudieri ATCC MYA-4762]
MSLSSEHEVRQSVAPTREDIVFTNPFSGRPIRKVSYKPRPPRESSPLITASEWQRKVRRAPQVAERARMRASTLPRPCRRRQPRRPTREKLREDAAARMAAVEAKVRKAREKQHREDAEALAAGKRRSSRLRRQPVWWAVEG